MSQRTTRENPEENADVAKRAAPRAAVEPENVPLDPDVQAVIERWPELAESLKKSILEMVRGARD